MEQQYPTRQQAKLMATCGEHGCEECRRGEAYKWCFNDAGVYHYGKMLMEMHDALDSKQAEIDKMRHIISIATTTSEQVLKNFDEMMILLDWRRKHETN